MHRVRPTKALPLANHVLLASRHLDCARDQVARKFCAHRLDRMTVDGRFDARHHHAPGHIFSLNYIRYGAAVSIEPGELSSFFLIQIPLTGRAEITNGHQTVRSDRDRATILNANRHTVMHWHEGCEQALLQIDRKRLEHFVEGRLGHRMSGPILFDPVLDLTRRTGDEIRARIVTLFHAAEDGAVFGAGNPLLQDSLEQDFLDHFLRCQPSNIRHYFEAPVAEIQTRQMRRAVDFIHANLRRPLTMPEVAEAAGIAPRTLQVAFRRTRGCTAKEYLQGERLKRIRQELLNAGEDQSVAAIASVWGMPHLGRFAAAYHAAFGEFPRQTLQRRI